MPCWSMMTSHYGILEPHNVDVTRQIENDKVILTRVVKVLINLLKFIIFPSGKEKKRFVRFAP